MSSPEVIKGLAGKLEAISPMRARVLKEGRMEEETAASLVDSYNNDKVDFCKYFPSYRITLDHIVAPLAHSVGTHALGRGCRKKR